MIALPATPELVLSAVISPVLQLLPRPLTGDEATVMLLAIALQESGLRERVQVGGPAHGLWQFEKAGGVSRVLKHPQSVGYARTLCEQFNVPPTEAAVYWQLPENDELAAGFARLLLWTDPQKLPALGDVDDAFDLYIRTWRPGDYARNPVGVRQRWNGSYQRSLQAVPGASI